MTLDVRSSALSGFWCAIGYHLAGESFGAAVAVGCVAFVAVLVGYLLIDAFADRARRGAS